MAEQLVVNGGRGNVGRIPPLGLKVSGQGSSLGVVNVAGREGLDVVANRMQALQLRSEVDGARGLGRPPEVETGNTDGVTSSNNSVLLSVIKNPGEHAIQVFGRINAVLHVLSRSGQP